MDADLNCLTDNYELKLIPHDGRWKATITCYGFEDTIEASYSALGDYPQDAVHSAMLEAGFPIED